MESARYFLPNSYVFYYVDSHSKICVVAGNHRIAAKLELARQFVAAGGTAETEMELDFDPHLAAIQLITDIPSDVVCHISNGTTYHTPSLWTADHDTASACNGRYFV